MLLSRTKRRLLQLAAIIALAGCMSPCNGMQKPASTSRRGLRSQRPRRSSIRRPRIRREDLVECLSAEPTNQEALTMLGVVRGRQQRYAEAEALFRRVLQLNPNPLPPPEILADALLAQDNPDEGFSSSTKQAIDLNPQDIALKIAAVAARTRARRIRERAFYPECDQAGPLSPRPRCRLKLPAFWAGPQIRCRGSDPLVRSSPAAALDLAQVFIAANDADAV